MSCLCFRSRKKNDNDTVLEMQEIMSTNQRESTQVPNDSTLALIECIMPMVLPIFCKAVSKKLIDDGSLLYNEERITTFDENTPEEELPVGPVEVYIEDVSVVDLKTMKTDMIATPEFAWPEKDRVEELLRKVPGKGRSMMIVDLENMDCLVPFGKGIEIAFPVDSPVFKGDIEVGCGGDIEKGWVRLEVPKLRLWFVSATKKCYLAFMDRPKLTPHLHVNADRGRGDFFSLYLTEDGSLDNVVETVLAGFGPNLKKGKTTSRVSDSFSTWIGDAVGGMLSKITQSTMGLNKKRENMPYEVDLSQTIDLSIDAALGKPRKVEVVKEQIKLLEEELERAIKAEEKD